MTAETYQEYLFTNALDLTIRADEDEQRFYVWCSDFPDVPPIHNKRLEIAVRNWMQDFETAMQSGEVVA